MTAIEYMDMRNRTMTTPQATAPMFLAMCMRSICMRDSSWTKTLGEAPGLLEPEVDGHGHDHRHGHAVEQRRRIDPLLHGRERGFVEQGDAAQDLGFADTALGTDGALLDDHALHPRLLGDVGIGGQD